MRYFLTSVFVISLIIFSCGKKAIIRHYYVIEFPIELDSTQVNKVPFTTASCEILPVQVAPAFAKKRIAVRTKTHELAYYFYHEWAVRPEEALANLLEGYLQSQRLFGSASRQIWKTRPDYQIQARVHQLEAIQREDKLLAHLHMDLELVDNQSDQILVFHSFDREEELEDRKINLLAAGISEIFESELQRFLNKIQNYIYQRENISTP